MGDPSKLGSLGAKTLILYMLTTLAAITIGLILAVFLQPGVGVDLTGAPAQPFGNHSPVGTPDFDCAGKSDRCAGRRQRLAIIFFAILIGVGLLSVGESGKPVADFVDASSEVVLRITHWIMEIAPFGVLALIARVTGAQGFDALLNAVVLAITVLIACPLPCAHPRGHYHAADVKTLAHQFLPRSSGSMLVAFSVMLVSDSAGLHVGCEDNLGVKPVVASAVLPLGATINMDGTALYVGIISVRSAGPGIDLTLTDYLIMAGTTTLVSVGTAAVPVRLCS